MALKQVSRVHFHLRKLQCRWQQVCKSSRAYPIKSMHVFLFYTTASFLNTPLCYHHRRYGDIMYTECTDADTVGQYWCAVAGWSDSSSWGWCDCNDSDAQLPPTPPPPTPLPPTTTVDAEHKSAGCSASAASSFGGPGATTNLKMGGMQHKLTLPTNYVQGRPVTPMTHPQLENIDGVRRLPYVLSVR